MTRSTSRDGSVERPRDDGPQSMAAAPEAWRPRRRRHITVELRQVSDPLPDGELRRREQELERLIIKAACRRAARLAGQSGGQVDDAHAPVSMVG